MEAYTLASLPVGSKAVITKMQVTENEAARLAQLGLIPGTELICKIRTSDDGMTAFTVRGVKLALRAELCQKIQVQELTRHRTYLLAGNPNVGKSTVFNALTGMKQHTGNWCGKTVTGAVGTCTHSGTKITLIDTPGTYSLQSKTAEEAAAAEIIRSTPNDCIFCICDATAPERGIQLALELRTPDQPVILCINLMDEAQKKHISIDIEKLSELLCMPVIGITARKKKQAAELLDAAEKLCSSTERQPCNPCGDNISPHQCAACIAAKTIHIPPNASDKADAVDRIITHRIWHIPLMLLFLLLVFWLTVTGANYPSALLAKLCSNLCMFLRQGADAAGLPEWLTGAAIDGALRGTGWVVSVMLPPMAIFFPLFTLLEDAGLLPRFALTADSRFARCSACGKQCLTMAMGFGCNAVGVTECRIIENRRERLIAILTNALVPCNGRFPMLMAVIAGFFSGSSAGSSLQSAGILTGLILLSIFMTMLASLLLSKTVLRGQSAPFVLELPPFRMPQIGTVLVRSVLDRTVFVLGRAVMTAAPAGVLIWLLANIEAGGSTLLKLCAGFLEPASILLGIDGVTVFAFILGIPANEIILPVAVTAYLGNSLLTDYGSYSALHTLLTAHGWTVHQAACFLMLALFHAPCATTLLTVRRETGSRRLTLAAFLLPSLIGILCTMSLSALLTAAGI